MPPQVTTVYRPETTGCLFTCTSKHNVAVSHIVGYAVDTSQKQVYIGAASKFRKVRLPKGTIMKCKPTSQSPAQKQMASKTSTNVGSGSRPTPSKIKTESSAPASPQKLRG
jgi:hypothetical protein